MPSQREWDLTAAEFVRRYLPTPGEIRNQNRDGAKATPIKTSKPSYNALQLRRHIRLQRRQSNLGSAK